MWSWSHYRIYDGAAHKHCNFLRSFTRTKIPVFFHNSQGYDSHFVIDEISRCTKMKKIEIIPKTKDKYISYSFDGLQFKDSFSFMASSLDNLVKILRSDEDYDSSRLIFATNFFKERYPNINNEDLKLLLKRGVSIWVYG